MLELILGVIGTVLYPMFGIIFLFIDLIQAIFEAFAGIGTIYVKSGAGYVQNHYSAVTSENTGDIFDTGIVYYLLNSTIVKNLFMSILILAVFLIIIFTAMAFIKNVYQTKQKSWQEIIGNALKGVMSFVFIPVACLLGVWVGNIVLKAINAATSTSNTTSMSRKLFISAAYNANKYRNNSKDAQDAGLAIEIASLVYGENYSSKITIDGNKTDENGNFDYEYYADIVDRLYGVGKDSKPFGVTNSEEGTPRAIWEWGNASKGYNLQQFNYLILLAGGSFMCYVLGSLAFGMVKRIFILLTLFVISPAICAMYPLDEGKAVGTWKEKFVKEVVSAYAAVAGMNIFFSLLPLVDQIGFAFWSSSASIVGWVNSIYHLFIIVAGLIVVKELISTIAEMIGANEAMGAGANLMDATKKKVSAGAKKVTQGAFGYVGAAVHGAQNGGVGGFFGGIGNKMFDDVMRTTGANDLVSAAGQSFNSPNGFFGDGGTLANSFSFEGRSSGHTMAERRAFTNQIRNATNLADAVSEGEALGYNRQEILRMWRRTHGGTQQQANQRLQDDTSTNEFNRRANEQREQEQRQREQEERQAQHDREMIDYRVQQEAQQREKERKAAQRREKRAANKKKKPKPDGTENYPPDYGN